MNQIEALSPSIIHDLEIYKSIVEGKRINQVLTLEDLTAVKELTEVIPKLEEEAKPVMEEIQQLEIEIQEKQEKIRELESNIDVRLKYLKSIPEPKPTVTRTSNGNSPINKESVLKVLKEELAYGGGNAAICEKLNVTNDKANQNKVYTIAKQLESEGKVKSENRMWKAL